MPKSPSTMKANQGKFLDLIREGHSILSACKVAQIKRQTYYNWRARYPEFLKASDEARLSQITVVEDALYKSAIQGNVTAQIFYLVNRSRYIDGAWQHVANVNHNHSIEDDKDKPNYSLLSETELVSLRELENKARSVVHEVKARKVNGKSNGH